MNFLKRACLSLWARKGRTLVMLATFLVMSVMVLGGVLINDATARAGEQAKRKIGADVSLAMAMDSLGLGGGGLQAPQISTDVVDKLGKSPLVDSYNYDSHDGAQLVGGTKITGKSVDESRPDFVLPRGVLDSRLMPDFASGKWKLLAGKPITAADKNRNVVLIEERLAKKNRLKPGDKITLAPNEPKKNPNAEFTVQGVYRDPSNELDPEFWDSPGDRLITPTHAFARFNGQKSGATQIGAASFKLKDPATFDDFTSWAKKEAGPALKGFKLSINDKAIRQMTGPMDSVSSTATIAMWLIGISGAAVLSLLVTLAVKQRTREYGVLLALGENKAKVIAQQTVEIVAVAALAIGLSVLFAEPLTQSAGNSLVSGEAAAAQKEIDSWKPPSPGSTGVGEGTDWDKEPVPDANPIDKITVRLDNGSLATVVGTGLGIALLATAIPASSVLRLNPKTILTKGK
ncbi:ABC transporter permease [Streptomyces sp. NPDC004726]